MGTKNRNSLARRMKPYTMMYIMLLPAIAIVLIFSYGPMYGLQMAFRNFNLGLGIWNSPWVGLQHFRTFLSTQGAIRALRNTVIISIYHLIFGFPAPIILAIIFNEINSKYFKRVSQSISYLPHFVSWIIVAGLMNNFFSPTTGIVNNIITRFGGTPIFFMASTTWFRPMLVMTNIWKSVGWGSVVFLAAIAGIDSTLYEAAIVDGASRLQRIRNITLPQLYPVISIMLIFNLGGIMNAGFDQIFNLYNPQVFEVADILDTYVFRMGLVNMNYSFATAVGLFRSGIGFVLVITVNQLIRKLNPDSRGILF
ncbi:MAG: ABC transporter permease subunit [Defluviitaleaceae bacterium]|nr:ABC transporter permease subunit [Defluviitaleaceae bacterium]